MAAAGAFCFFGQASFAGFCEKLAKESLSNNPLKLHYTLADPESMGYGALPMDLSVFYAEAYENNTAVWQEYLNRLESYDPDSLPQQEAFTWRLLQRYFTLEEELSTYLYYENPLSPADGTHIQLPVLLAEYAFRSREDVDHYLTLLSQLPDYFRGLLIYARQQAQAGMLQYEGNLETVTGQCESILNEEQLASGGHFLQTTFQARLEALTEEEAEGLREEEAESLMEENQRLLEELAQAYQELAEGLSGLEGTDQLTGLAAFPDGAEYYALLLAQTVGSDRSVSEMKEMLSQRLEELYAEYRGLITDGTIVSEYVFPMENEADMLEDLFGRMEKDFPELAQLSQTVTLKPVAAGLEDMMAPAFYLTPPVDQNQEHTIYINQSDGYEGLSLYTTLAHEGFPGHLYQTVYSQNALTEEEAPFIRQLLYYGGYTEGWGIYSESWACQFAAQLLGEEYGDTVRASQLNRELQLCLCSILDIFIHYDGATLSQVQQLLQSMGFGGGNVSAVYETICNSPANYPKYYVGYLEILELKELAFENDHQMTEREFHRWLLSCGPADFTSLREELLRAS
ncbi:MAG: DUF885 domain-containing protein [Lachnospiraceae bacterium]|nr:DUF885 domain-containing protein [Lachnospiraceae bacterium]